MDEVNQHKGLCLKCSFELLVLVLFDIFRIRKSYGVFLSSQYALSRRLLCAAAQEVLLSHANEDVKLTTSLGRIQLPMNFPAVLFRHLKESYRFDN